MLTLLVVAFPGGGRGRRGFGGHSSYHLSGCWGQAVAYGVLRPGMLGQEMWGYLHVWFLLLSPVLARQEAQRADELWSRQRGFHPSSFMPSMAACSGQIIL